MKNEKNLGFTLMEILVVMVIIGILATIGFGSFNSSQVKSRDSKRKADLRHIGEALEAYYNDMGRYPDEVDFNVLLINGSPFLNPNDNSTIYMVNLPKDPGKTNTHYYYISDDSGSFYQIYSKLENLEDRDLKRGTESNAPLFYQDTVCGASVRCNFGISSSNVNAEFGQILMP